MNAALHVREASLPLPAGGGRLRYRQVGAGPAVLMLHGWALDLDQWAEVADALADSFRVVRIDRPGFGESSGVASSEADVRAIAATVAALGLAPVALVACSQAGRGVLRYALSAGPDVSALVLDGAPLEGFVPGPDAEHAAPVAELAAILDRDGAAAVQRALAAHAFFRLRCTDAAATAKLAAMLNRYDGRDLQSTAVDPPVNVAARLGELPMPALIVNGEFDTPHRRLMGDALAYGLPRAERIVIGGAGHLAALEKPRDYAALLREFLVRHLQPTGRMTS
jgi:pimeloyl-ACP methyl ester carboxylesterase